MDELEIDGKIYLSSRRAAKEHKYHIDYIGQLIRGGKIVGKKVGRSWYVEAGSLKSYLAAEGSAPQAQPEPQTQPQARVEAPQPIISQRESPPSPFEPVQFETKQDTVVAKQQEAEPVKVFASPAPVTRQTIYEEPTREIKLEAEHKPTTLTYIEDTEPLLPALDGRMRSNADFVAVPLRKIAEPEAVEEEVYEEEPAQVEVYPRKAKNNFTLRRMQVLGVIAILVLAFAALGSTLLATSIKVTDGGTASVGFSLK